MLLGLAGCSGDPRYQRSAQPAYIPAAGESYADYLQENRRRLRTALQRTHFAEGRETAFQGSAVPAAGAGYDLEAAVTLRAPFELRGECPAGEPERAFLLLHGLTDSPYLMRPVGDALVRAFPCSLVRSLLLPGHGTAPADTLGMTVAQWRTVVAWGVQGLQALPDVRDITLVGFSTGTSLSLDYLNSGQSTAGIERVVMISPAFKAASDLAWLTVWVDRLGLNWMSKHAEYDAARYESFTYKAAREFYQLTRGMSEPDYPALALPVFMAVTGDDSTVAAGAALDFYCDKRPAGDTRSRLLWYQSPFAGSAPGRRDCAGMTVVPVEGIDARVLSYSHIGLSMPPDDPHYGRDGNYRHCRAYGEDSTAYRDCVQGRGAVFYGESNVPDAALDGALLRRGTYNPSFDAMMRDILCFIEPTRCAQAAGR